MANISTISYNGKVIAETEEPGNVVVTYDGRTIAEIVAGETKNILCSGKVMKTNLYIGGKTLLCEMAQMITDIVVAVKSAFPAEPTAYMLMAGYSDERTWVAPEDGWFQFELVGASGNGGASVISYIDLPDGTSRWVAVYTGGGGGGGGFAASRVKMKKGDTAIFAARSVGNTSTVSFNSSIESYSVMQVTSAANGTKATESAVGVGGAGGVASGGNYINNNGGSGENGVKNTSQSADADGGAGGTCYHNLNKGGNGGGYKSGLRTSEELGENAIIKVYRGNTNKTNEEIISADPVLANNSWTTIGKISKLGLAREFWKLGDEKSLVVNGTTYSARIIGFDHDNVADSASYGRTEAGITFELTALCELAKYNNSATTAGGWGSSALRNTTMAGYYNNLETELKAVIVPVTKEYIGTYNSATLSYIIDNLFALSEMEYFGKAKYGITTEGTQYEYWYMNNSLRKTYNGTQTTYWTRTPAKSSNGNEVCVRNTGASTYGGVTATNFGFTFAFCV